MAGPYYARSTDGNNADTGLTWALAKADLHTATTGALAVMASGEILYVSQAHAQSTSSANVALTAVNAGGPSPVSILCADDAGGQPVALAATASITAATNGYGITIAGSSYWYGLIFATSNGSSGSNTIKIGLQQAIQNSFAMLFEACKFRAIGTSATNLILVGPVIGTADYGYSIRFLGCEFKFGATGASIGLQVGRFHFHNMSLDGTGSIPSVLFKGTTYHAHETLVENSDLSAVTGTLYGVAGANQKMTFRNCKLAAAVAVFTGTIAGLGTEIHLENCDSTDSQYRDEHHYWGGSFIAQTAVVRNGGATVTHNAASVPIGYKATGLANKVLFSIPLSSPLLYLRNTVTTEQTATVHVIHGESADLNNDEIWLRLVHQGTSGFPLGVELTDRKTDVLASASAQATDATTDWDDGATAYNPATTYSVAGTIVKPTTPDGSLQILVSGSGSGAEPSWAGADGGEVTANGCTWRRMRRQKIEVTFTAAEQGGLFGQVCIGKKTTFPVYFCPKPDVA